MEKVRHLIRDNKFVLFAHNGGGFKGNWDDSFEIFLLNNQAREVVKIDFPFGSKSIYNSIRCSRYINNDKVFDGVSLIKFCKPEIISYLKDFVYGIVYGIRFGRNTFLFVGMDNLLAFTGLILRKFGLVKKVAYCMVDYTPKRFNNRIINEFYYLIDRYVCYNSDLVWPLHKRMLEGRSEDGRIVLDKVCWVEAPFGNNSSKIMESEYSNYDINKIVYYGGILKSKGSEILVDIIQKLVEKGKTEIKLVCIGGGDLDYLKKRVEKSGLQNNIEIMGIISDDLEAAKIMLSCGVALAPYDTSDPNNFSRYADPGKIKTYLGCGLPVLVTNVPPIAKDIEANKAGMVVQYNSEDIANKIIYLSDSGLYKQYRSNAINMGKNYDWDILFTNLMDKSFIYE